MALSSELNANKAMKFLPLLMLRLCDSRIGSALLWRMFRKRYFKNHYYKGIVILHTEIA